MRSRDYEKGFDDCEDIYKDKVAKLKKKLKKERETPFKKGIATKGYKNGYLGGFIEAMKIVDEVFGE